MWGSLSLSSLFSSRFADNSWPRTPVRYNRRYLTSVVGSAFAQSHTPLNILGGFKEAGIYPFNPGEVSDRQLAPSKALKKQTSPAPTYSQEQVQLFEQRYSEGYDLPDPTYLAWKSAKHPSSDSVSPPGSSASVVAGTMSTANASNLTSPASVVTTSSQKSSEEVLNELLQLPQPPPARTSCKKSQSMTKLKKSLLLMFYKK